MWCNLCVWCHTSQNSFFDEDPNPGSNKRDTPVIRITTGYRLVLCYNRSVYHSIDTGCRYYWISIPNVTTGSRIKGKRPWALIHVCPFSLCPQNILSFRANIGFGPDFKIWCQIFCIAHFSKHILLEKAHLFCFWESGSFDTNRFIFVHITSFNRFGCELLHVCSWKLGSQPKLRPHFVFTKYKGRMTFIRAAKQP